MDKEDDNFSSESDQLSEKFSVIESESYMSHSHKNRNESTSNNDASSCNGSTNNDDSQIKF